MRISPCSIAALAAVGEDQAAGLVDLLAHHGGQAEDLLVGQVRPQLLAAQAGGKLQLAAGRGGGRRRGRRHGAGQQARARREAALLEEALAVPLQAVEGGMDLVLARAKHLRQLAAAPAEDLLEGLDAPPQPAPALVVALVEQQEGLDGGLQGGLEALALELGAAQALGDLAVEGVPAQRPGKLLGGAVEVLAAKQQAAVQGGMGGVGQVLGLGHLEALDGAGVLAPLGVEVGEAEEVRGVDGVAAKAFAQHLAQAAAAAVAAALELLQLADLRQRQLDRQVLGIEAQREQQQLGRLVVPGGGAHAPRQVGELIDLWRQLHGLVLRVAHAGWPGARRSARRV